MKVPAREKPPKQRKSKRKSKADKQATEPNPAENEFSEEEFVNGPWENGHIDEGKRSDEEGDGEKDDHVVAEESDSSEDEVPDRNTVGQVPLEWYKEEEHIGYDITGKKIKKQARKDKIDSFLAGVDNSGNWRNIFDEYNDKEVELTKKEINILRRLLKGRTPHKDFDQYEQYIDWFKYEDKDHGLSSDPEPKRRFIPSKSENKKVVKLVRAIRKGLIKFGKPKEEEPNVYLLWGDDSSSADNGRHGLSYIPPRKSEAAGHEESYNPSLEYIPTQEEINSLQLMDDEGRHKFIPRRYVSLRSVPAYEKSLYDIFNRCLDLYLCPRARKKRINIDPESLKPKLPSRKDLKPYPTTCYLEYKGHRGPVTSLSVDVSGEWIASGSIDGTARIWEVETGRCLRIWEFGEPVKHIAWNPLSELPILAVSMGQDVVLFDSGLGNTEQQPRIKEVLRINESVTTDESSTSPVTWSKHERYDGIMLKHFKSVSKIEWHRKGDYFCTVVPSGDSKAVLIHRLSTKETHNSVRRLHGLPVSAIFHPSRTQFFVATKKNIRVYDLATGKLIKKLEPGVREVSSIAIHPAGDNLIVGSKEGKLCWFDMDLASRPYKNLSIHSKDITNVAFHRTYPLFASSSEDCTAYVAHGMVYSDLDQDPLIVPLKILRGTKSTDGRGVLDCKFHPKQPWLFTAGSDSVIKLYCH